MNSSFAPMDLLTAVTAYIQKEQLLSSADKPILAVSGGLDSVVLTDLLHRAGYDFRIVHCNFQLRGEESIRDEQFVAALGRKYQKEVIIGHFETQEYAVKHKVSIQVAAREQRYIWFRVMSDCVVTAHHQDDNIETLLMNFFKGTGINGLRAMLPKQSGIIRPLLFARREELEEYAREQGLEWVEDSSNVSDKYTRNYFRHQLIPMLQQVYPEVRTNLANNIERFREIDEIYKATVARQKSSLLEVRGEEVYIPVLKLKKASPLSTIVYEIISSFDFTPQQTGAVIDLMDSGSGKYVHSRSHRILKDRGWLIISPRGGKDVKNILIEETKNRSVGYSGGTLQLEIKEEVPEELRKIMSGEADPASVPRRKGTGPVLNLTAWVDADLIQWPLLLRPWREGDYFYPLGMRKKKKLGRFFIDNKLSLVDKEKVWVLEMDKKVVWVVGLRIDDRFRVTEGTKRIIKLSYSLKSED